MSSDRRVMHKRSLKNKMIRNFIFYPLTLLANKLLVAVAQANGSPLKSCHGIKFYVPGQYREMIDESMADAFRFFGTEWTQYKGLLKTVIIHDLMDSNFLPSHGVLIINKSDQGQLASATHLASWLISYFRMIKIHKENHIGPVFWKNHIYDLAREEGAAFRKKYLATR